CEGKQCGDDGCGSSCGSCSYPRWCDGASGQCVSTCSCAGRECGDDGCGGSCGQCPPDSYCDRSGRCASTRCDPPCSSSQWCDTSQPWPLCIELCNPPVGCAEGEVCDGTTGRCRPPTCDGAACQQGQGCYDPQTMTSGDVCTCLPYWTDPWGMGHPDTCAAYGLACDWDYDSPRPATCRLPREFEECVPNSPCEAGLECVSLSGYNLCMQPCRSSSDCATPYTTCMTQLRRHCYYNICADPGSNPSERSRYYQPCTSLSPGDSRCIPWVGEDGEGGAWEIGLCLQGGVAPHLGACSTDADRTRMSELCPVDELCMPIQPDPDRPGETLGTCQRACNAGALANPPAPCSSSTDVCLDYSSLQDGMLEETRPGVCYRRCDLFGSDACPPDALQNPTGCSPAATSGSEGYCRALAPNAQAPGAVCEELLGDLRNPCADRLACVDTGMGPQCVGYCSVDSCPNPFTSCGSCRPSQYKCYSYLDELGVCLP
ncbi:MAG: hypothetical protein HY901_10980, partial [Deltaproteobacteria bacterium]|nr:hypothetical protein [Deltaproteobacteria bacterium]